MSLGERITELRKLAGMSQGELSKAMELSRQAVSKWENGQSVPDATNLIRLAEILDTDIEYLATGRRTYGRRPPVVIKTTETVEKIVEKPVIQEKIVEKVVEKLVEVPVVEFVEKPIVKYRTEYVQKPLDTVIVGVIGFLLGILVGVSAF